MLASEEQTDGTVKNFYMFRYHDVPSDWEVAQGWRD